MKIIYFNRVILALSAIGIGGTVPCSLATPSIDESPSGLLLAMAAGFFFLAALSTPLEPDHS